MNCLNGARWLPETFDSVRAQTFQDYEIIFWDNHSTDESAAIAKAYGPQLVLWQNSETLPLGTARNRAIAMARGRYIAFLDCDDLWLPEKLALQVRLFEQNPRLGLVCTDTEIFTGDKIRNRMFAGNTPARGMVFAELVERQWISMSSAMLRADAIASCRLPGTNGCFDENLNICEEADLFYRIAHDWELDYIDASLTRWRMHTSNTTFTKFDRLAAETATILERQRQLFTDFDKEYPQTAALLSNRAAFQEALALWREGRNREARAMLAKISPRSLKHRAFQLASWLPGFMFDFFSRLYFSLPRCFRR